MENETLYLQILKTLKLMFIGSLLVNFTLLGYIAYDRYKDSTVEYSEDVIEQEGDYNLIESDCNTFTNGDE